MRRLLVVFFALWSAAAAAVGPENPKLAADPDYRDAERLIKTGKYAEALPFLRRLDAAHPAEPEVLTWLGFTYRKVKAYQTARSFYDAALKVEPTYRPALAYQGQWFIETGDIPSATANLAKLRQICASCEETKDLEVALKQAGH